MDPYPDLYYPSRPALAANPLAAGRIEPLSTSEEVTLAALSAGPLFTAWGGAAPRQPRVGARSAAGPTRPPSR